MEFQFATFLSSQNRLKLIVLFNLLRWHHAEEINIKHRQSMLVFLVSHFILEPADKLGDTCVDGGDTWQTTLVPSWRDPDQHTLISSLHCQSSTWVSLASISSSLRYSSAHVSVFDLKNKSIKIQGRVFVISYTTAGVDCRGSVQIQIPFLTFLIGNDRETCKHEHLKMIEWMMLNLLENILEWMTCIYRDQLFTLEGFPPSEIGASFLKWYHQKYFITTMLW